jgi:hypothetical protein
VKRVVASAIVAFGLVMWLGGANSLLRRHRIHSRRIFGRRWPVGVNWLSLTGGEWLRLFALTISALAVMMLGFWVGGSIR